MGRYQSRTSPPTSIIDSMDCRCASARESFGSQVLARNVPTISLVLASSLTLEIEEQKITFFYYLAELRCINGRNIAPPETSPPANFRAESKAPGLSTTPRGYSKATGR